MNQETLNKEWHSIHFGVRRSVRYHDRRIKFYDLLNRSILFINVVSGSAAVVSVLSSLGNALVTVFAAVVAVTSAFDLAVDTGSKARLHTDLKRRFSDLEKQMNLVDVPDQEAVTKTVNMRLEIEQDEPPIHRALDILCHNELVRADGYADEHLHDVPRWKRYMAHVL